MIFIGYTDEQKRIEIERYKASHDITKTVVISADQFPLPIPDTDQVTYSDVIMYVTYYRLLQEIDHRTLIVINECLRTQNRYDLTYNCIRNYLNQTEHQLIFQQLPQIDTQDDFMVLFDFDTRSRWKRRKFDLDLILDNSRVCVRLVPIQFKPVQVPTSEVTCRKYRQERQRRFETIGNRDPHTIPRNLHLIGGKDKLAYIQRLGGSNGQLSLLAESRPKPRVYVARNQRLNDDSIITYQSVDSPLCDPITLVDLPHRFIDLSDFIKTSRQSKFEVLVTDLKVDHWYIERYKSWKERIDATCASLQS